MLTSLYNKGLKMASNKTKPQVTEAQRMMAALISYSKQETAADPANPLTLETLIATVEKQNPLMAMQIRELVS